MLVRSTILVILILAFMATAGVAPVNVPPIGSSFCPKIAARVDLSLRNRTLFRHTFIRHFRGTRSLAPTDISSPNTNPDTLLRRQNKKSQRITRQQNLS